MTKYVVASRASVAHRQSVNLSPFLVIDETRLRLCCRQHPPPKRFSLRIPARGHRSNICTVVLETVIGIHTACYNHVLGAVIGVHTACNNHPSRNFGTVCRYSCSLLCRHGFLAPTQNEVLLVPRVWADSTVLQGEVFGMS